MEFFRFLEKESKALDRRLMVLGVIAGMLNMFIIFTLMVAAGKAVQSESNLWQLAIVALALFAFWLSETTLMRHMTVIVEKIVRKFAYASYIKFGTPTWLRSSISGERHPIMSSRCMP